MSFFDEVRLGHEVCALLMDHNRAYPKGTQLHYARALGNVERNSQTRDHRRLQHQLGPGDSDFLQ